MEYTEEALEDIARYKSEIPQMLYASVLSLKDTIKMLIKQRWLKGESVYGGVILNKQTGLGYASLKYKNEKLIKNPLAGGNVDLTYTGALGDAIELLLESNGNFQIISTDPKYIAITLKYGVDEIGLTQNESEIILDSISKLLEEQIKTL